MNRSAALVIICILLITAPLHAMQPQAPQKQMLTVLTSDKKEVTLTQKQLEYFPLLKNAHADRLPIDTVNCSARRLEQLCAHFSDSTDLDPTNKHIRAIDFLKVLDGPGKDKAYGMVRKYCENKEHCDRALKDPQIFGAIQAAATAYRGEYRRSLLKERQFPDCIRRALENDRITPNETGYAFLQVQCTTEGIKHVPGINAVRSLEIWFTGVEDRQNVLTNDVGNLTTLQKLKIEDCNGITDRLPSTIGLLCNLTCLKMPYLDLCAVPASLTELQQLAELDIHWTLAAEYETPAFSRVIPFLTSLRTLKGTGPRNSNACDQKECAAVVRAACSLPQLKELDLSWETSLVQLPPKIRDATRLQKLRLSDSYLRELPTELCSLTQLQALDLGEAKGLPNDLGNMQSLTKLCMVFCRATILPSSVTQLTNLATLNIICAKCTNLEILAGMTWLKKLYMDSTQAEYLKTHGTLLHPQRRQEERQKKQQKEYSYRASWDIF